MYMSQVLSEDRNTTSSFQNGIFFIDVEGNYERSFEMYIIKQTNKQA
jgi:hypothetical protein